MLTIVENFFNKTDLSGTEKPIVEDTVVTSSFAENSIFSEEKKLEVPPDMAIKKSMLEYQLELMLSHISASELPENKEIAKRLEDLLSSIEVSDVNDIVTTQNLMQEYSTRSMVAEYNEGTRKGIINSIFGLVNSVFGKAHKAEDLLKKDQVNNMVEDINTHSLSEVKNLFLDVTGIIGNLKKN
jgi:hypothetical protein